MRGLVLLMALCALSLGSAAEADRVRRHTMPYDSSAIAWSKQQGSAGVTGTATWTLRGKRVSCSNGSAMLVARSPYADESVAGSLGNIERATVPVTKAAGFYDFDRRYFQDARKAACDARGFFQFSSLPAGEYYVLANIGLVTNVMVVNGANYRDVRGVIHMQRIQLSDGAQIALEFN